VSRLHFFFFRHGLRDAYAEDNSKNQLVSNEVENRHEANSQLSQKVAYMRTMWSACVARLNSVNESQRARVGKPSIMWYGRRGEK
jgi:hypothetical protein